MDLIGFAAVIALVFVILLVVAFVVLAVSLFQKKAWVLLGLLVVVPFLGACLLVAGALLLRSGSDLASGEFDSSPTAPAFLDQPTLERAYEDGIAQVRLEEAVTRFEEWIDRSAMEGALEAVWTRRERKVSSSSESGAIEFDPDGHYLVSFNLEVKGNKKAFDLWFAEFEQRPDVKLVSLSMMSPEGGADVVAQLEMDLRYD